MKMLKIKNTLMAALMLAILWGCTVRPRTTKSNTTPPPVKTETTQTPIIKKEEPKKVESKNDSPKTENTNSKTEISKTQTEPKKNVESPKKLTVKLPEVNREFRAAWIATVANINWPSKRGLSTEQQKSEAIQLLDMLKDNNFNAVIFQARPSADALYDSPYEPWSIFLTGQIGKRPEPYYDPMEFWIKEAHERGIEFHVWINPYRAHHTNGGSVTNESIARKKSDVVVRLQNGMYWFDPAKKEVQDYTSMIVKDIVRRYDIDGIHFDDYFYPYASYNGGKDFPDQATYAEYLRNGGHLSKPDWRRENVNNFIERIYNEIKAEKNHVKFGISPFGIWKPGYPEGISGLNQYDELYADAKLWLNKGWLDYFTPQLYWPVDAPKQSFPKLLSWWDSENTYKRHLWPGLNTVEIKAADRSHEIQRQIELTRSLVPKSQGVVHYSIAGLINNPKLLNALKNGLYQEPALVPKSEWLNSFNLGQPFLNYTIDHSKANLHWNIPQDHSVQNWVLYLRYGDEWETVILENYKKNREVYLEKGSKKLNLVAVQAIDRNGFESEYIAQEIM
jgi:uncharacterized lipoprotein YddW (UPF0748 family)